MGEMVDRVLNEPEILIDKLIEAGEIHFEKKSVIIEGQNYHKNKGPCFGAIHDLFDDYCRREKPQDGSLVKLFFYKLLEDKGTASAKIPLIRDLTRKIMERVGEMTPEEGETQEVDYTSHLGGGKLRLARDMFRPKLYVYNHENFELSAVDVDSFLAAVGRTAAKELTDDALPCKMVFNPRTTKLHWDEVVEDAGLELPIKCFNSFKPPAYRFLEAPTPTSLAEIDEDLESYFDTLCEGDEDTRHVILSWLKIALLDKAKTILVLVGQGETGKTFLAKLFGALVGRDYFMEAQNDFFDTKFVSGLNMHRCLFIDEGRMVTPGQMGNAKKYVEDRISAERKGEEALPNQQVHASLIFASNYMDSCAFRPNERKFTVPDAGNVRQRWGTREEWIDFENRWLEGDNEKTKRRLKKLYNYLCAYETNWKPTTHFRGERYWELVVAGGLTTSEKIVYDRLSLLEDETSLAGFVAACNRVAKDKQLRINVTAKNVSRLLTDFKMGGRSIGEIYKSDGGEDYICKCEEDDELAALDDSDEDLRTLDSLDLL